MSPFRCGLLSFPDGWRAYHGCRMGAPAARPAHTQGADVYRVDPRRMWYHWKYLDEIRPFIKGPDGDQRHPDGRRRQDLRRTRLSEWSQGLTQRDILP